MGFNSLLYCGYFFGRRGFIFGGIIMWIFFITLVGISIFIAVSFYKKNKSTVSETPLDILNKRYISGEISKEEYNKIKKEIM
jgi:putative membrane protein